MKYEIISLLYIFHVQITQADNMTIMNLTSQPATVTLNTASKSFTINANPNENLYVQQNLDTQTNIQYDNPLTTLSYDHGQIQKITVQRTVPDRPQIIYYNDEITLDSNNKAAGIYGTFVSRGGNLTISHDDITINNLTYNINDLNSLKIKALSLKNQLKINKNIDKIQKEVNDLAQSLRLIELSDSASIVALQIIAIKSEFDALINTLKIIKQTKDYLNNLQSLEKNLTSDNVDETQNQINDMLMNLSTLDHTNLKNIANIDAIKSKIAQIQNKIISIKNKLDLNKRTMLINADSPSM